MIVGPRGQKLYELGIPCPEYSGLKPEYPGVTVANQLDPSNYMLRPSSHSSFKHVLLCWFTSVLHVQNDVVS